MAQPVDTGSKKLISLDPTAWVRWVTGLPDVTAGEPWDQEFQFVSRRSDVLVPAHSESAGDFLLPCELALRYNELIPERMAAYSSLAREKYHLPTCPVLVVMLPPARGKKIPEKFAARFLGKRTLVEYTVLRMWEMDVALVFDMPVPTLLPFVPLMKDGADETMVRRAAVVLHSHEQLTDLQPLLGILASYVLDPLVVQKIVRGDMVTILNNPFREEIKQIVRLEGRQDAILALLSEPFRQAPPEISRVVRMARSDELLRRLLLRSRLPVFE